MLEIGVVELVSVTFLRQVRRNNRGMFSILFNMNVCSVFSLELPHRGDSNEFTQYTIFNVKRHLPKLSLNLQLWDFFKGLKNESETAVVNELHVSMFESLKFYYKSPSS